MGRLSGDAPCACDCPSSGKLSREAGANEGESGDVRGTQRAGWLHARRWADDVLVARTATR